MARRAREVAKVRMLSKLVGIVVGVGACRRSVPKKKAHPVEESTTVSQDTIMVGSVGRYFDVGSVSEVTLEPRGADEKICSMGAPNVREGESVDIEIDAGAEASCLLAQTTYPLHETRLSVCGFHHAAGGGKLHELGARMLGLEAAKRARRCRELVGTISES